MQVSQNLTPDVEGYEGLITKFGGVQVRHSEPWGSRLIS